MLQCERCDQIHHEVPPHNWHCTHCGHVLGVAS